MTKTEVLGQIIRKVPKLRDKLTLDRIYFSRAENHAVFSFLAADLIGQEDFRLIKAVLFGCFPQMRVSVRVASPALGEAFLADPAPYQEPVLDFLCRRYPNANAWRKWLRLGAKNGHIELETPDAFSAAFETRDRLVLGMTAPAHGLVLAQVRYPEKAFTDPASIRWAEP